MNIDAETNRPPIPCPDCAGMMYLQEKPPAWGKGVVYLCENRLSGCRGLLSAHPNGEPCGTPADAYTRQARRKVHQLFDPLWQEAEAMYLGDTAPLNPRKLRGIARSRAYQWLAEILNLPVKKCHISLMNVEDLRSAWRAIRLHKPTMYSIREWAKQRKQL